MIKVDLSFLNGDTFYAGDQIELEICVKKEFKLKTVHVLDGSIQLVGRSVFVNDFYSYPRLQDLFGGLARIKEECRMLATDKGETFTLPMYVTRPALLELSEEEEEVAVNNSIWRGILPSNLPASFIGVFCAFQHVVKVRVAWKCVETGEIGTSESEIFFKVLQVRTKASVLGILDNFTLKREPNRIIDFDQDFPDDFDCRDEKKCLELMNKLKTIRCDDKREEDGFDPRELARVAVESDSGFKGSLSVGSSPDEIVHLGSIHVRKTVLFPGTQIFITVADLPAGLSAIKLTLECIETYPKEYLKSPLMESFVWREPVKSLKLKPLHFQDSIDILFPLPPELFSTIFTDFFSLQWQLAVDLVLENDQIFGTKIPIQLMAFKLDLTSNNK